MEQFFGLCCIKGCDLPVLAVGLCNKHWRRNRKYGSPALLARPSASFRGPPERRFFMQFQKSQECWVWSASKDKDGYGMFRGAWMGAMYARAHRFSWAYHNGKPIPDGAIICHSCDNPSCVNPAHLRLGTHEDNQRERRAKGRHFTSATPRPPAAKLTLEQVEQIRAATGRQRDIALVFGVTQTAVSDIKRGKTWAK